MQPNRAVPQRRPQLSEDAASYVRNMIMSGRLQPGAAVKAEAIGEQMGISATPVREALQALRVEGFLQLLPRKGFLVAPRRRTGISLSCRHCTPNFSTRQHAARLTCSKLRTMRSIAR
jgi:DNA-binding GntR family transcriptional regulator